MKTLLNQLVPKNNEGKQNDLREKISFNTIDEAKAQYKHSTQKLFDVNSWKFISDDKITNFFITDKEGHICDRPVEEGDFIKIDLPGPGNPEGEGFDWVKAELVIKHYENGPDNEGAGFTVRASSNPQKKEEGTAHFFSDSATSTFMIEREGTTIYATYHGRNEKINTSGDAISKVRNTIVAAGAMLGLSEAKWTDLLYSFLKDEGAPPEG